MLGISAHCIETVSALTEGINPDFFHLGHDYFLSICSPRYKPFFWRTLVHCGYKMASLMAQVTMLLSATNSMGTDDLNNPTNDDLNKMKVLGSMLICFPFSLRFLTAETEKTSRVQVHPLQTLYNSL